MKIILFTGIILYSLCLSAMQEECNNSQAIPIGRPILSVSYSPGNGNWISSPNASILDARRAQATIEHANAARKSDATEMVAFMGGESLELIEQLKKTLSVPMGDSEINCHLVVMLKKIRTSSKDPHDNLSDSEENSQDISKLKRTDMIIYQTRKNPELRAKMEEIIVEQALLINKIVKLFESK